MLKSGFFDFYIVAASINALLANYMKNPFITFATFYIEQVF